MNHYEDISSKIKNTLTVSFQIDSSALASWLSPYHIHKNVFFWNSSTKLHDLCKDISRDYDIQVDFSHVSGVLNIADYNSKTAVDVNPVDLVNSSEWGHENVGFTNDEFPGEEMIFFKYINGVMVKYQQPKVD